MSLQPGPDNTLTDIPYVPPVQVSQDENVDNLNVAKDANIVGNLTVNGYLSALGGSNISGGGGGGSLSIKDEGTTLTPSASSINFVGAKVTATNSGNAVTVAIDTNGLISGSSQVNYTLLSNIPSGLISGSSQLLSMTSVGNSNYSILVSDRYVVATASLTAPRIFILPLANSVSAGTTIIVEDIAGVVNGTNTITIQRSGSDTINGVTSEIIGAAYGTRAFRSDNISKWNFDRGILRTSNNLSDVLNASASLANLGGASIAFSIAMSVAL